LRPFATAAAMNTRAKSSAAMIPTDMVTNVAGEG
jgi:hypothetical protein